MHISQTTQQESAILPAVLEERTTRTSTIDARYDEECVFWLESFLDDWDSLALLEPGCDDQIHDRCCDAIHRLRQ